MKDEELHSHGLFLYRECDDYIGSNEKRLKTHIEKQHVKKRQITNYDILSKFCFQPFKHLCNNHWEAGLTFLQKLEPTQPTFRQSLINKIHGQTEEIVLELALDVIEASTEASKSASKTKRGHFNDYDPTTIWLLIILLEQLVLFPNKSAEDNKDNSLHNEIC